MMMMMIAKENKKNENEKKNNSQMTMYQILLQKFVLSQWKGCVERRKRLAWKVLVALRMRVFVRGLMPGVRKWEDEAGHLCLVS